MIWRTHWRLSWYSLLHLYAPETFTLTVHRLVGHVRILQNDSNCNTTNWHCTDWNTVGLLRRPFLRQTAFTNVKYSSISHSRSLPQTIVESVTTKVVLQVQPSLPPTVTERSNFSEQLCYPHVTLVMFQLFRFLDCNASKAW